MREEKPKSPSQKKKNAQKSWFWPAIYLGIAVVFVGMIWSYSALMKDRSVTEDPNTDSVIQTNAPKESLKYPFSEALLEDVAVLQEYYDMEASDEDREKALLVFNQSYRTNSGLSISIEGKPFEVVAAMSGTVENVIVDAFKGNEIILSHADGMSTIYGSLTDVLVKPGDQVIQGQPLGTTTQNEWNPKVGVHLHFEVQKDGKTMSPRKLLHFD